MSIITKAEILTILEEAWQCLPYSSEVHERLMEMSLFDFETNDARELFVGKGWWEISDDIIEAYCPDPFFIGDVPLRYFFPAFATNAVKKGNSKGRLAERLINDLTPPKKEKTRNNFLAKYEIYSQVEKWAIYKFLQYMYSVFSSEDDELSQRYAKRIKFAIREYWSPDSTDAHVPE
jgi:hypothetical protein